MAGEKGVLAAACQTSCNDESIGEAALGGGSGCEIKEDMGNLAMVVSSVAELVSES